MTNEQKFLLKQNGKQVTVDGLKYRLSVKTYEAIFPYKHVVVRTYLEPVSKKSEHYKEIRKNLKDDWSLSYDDSDVELQCEVLSQLGYYVESTSSKN